MNNGELNSTLKIEIDSAKIEMEKIIRDIMEMSAEELQRFRLEHLININQNGCPIQYVVTVDMGAGNTSAAVYKIDGQVQDKLRSYRLVQWYYPKKNAGRDTLHESIPTMIGYGRRKIVLGPEVLKCGYIIENFKQLPSDDALEQIMISDAKMIKSLEDVWTDYFREIWIYINNSLVGEEFPDLSLKNTLFVVAHPAGKQWADSKILDNYKRMIANGTGFNQSHVLTISESKAAMQYVRINKEKLVDFEKGVLIIDMGASTIDFEYLSTKCPEPLEWSITMAGRDIDRVIAYDALKQVFPAEMEHYTDNQIPDDDFFNHLIETVEGFEAPRAEFLYDARLTKEKLSDKYNDQACNIETEIFPVGSQDIEYSIGDLESLLNRINISAEYNDFKFEIQKMEETKLDTILSMPWMEHLRTTLENVFYELKHQENGQVLPVGKIIVTGGSCRLLGVERKIKQIKDNDDFYNDAQIVFMNKDNDYESSVPYGAIHYITGILYNAQRMLDFPDELSNVLRKNAIEGIGNCITKKVNNIVRPKIIDAMQWWCDQGAMIPLKDNPNQTLNGLYKCTTKQISGIKKENIIKVVNDGVDEYNNMDSLKEIEELVNKFLEEISGMKYQGDINLEGIRVTVDEDLMRNDILNTIKTLNIDRVGFSKWARFKLSAARWIQNIRGNEDIDLCPMPLQVRNEICREFFTKDTDISYKKTICKKLKETVNTSTEAAYDAVSAVNVGNILQNIRKHIMSALYLGTK